MEHPALAYPAEFDDAHLDDAAKVVLAGARVVPRDHDKVEGASSRAIDTQAGIWRCRSHTARSHVRIGPCRGRVRESTGDHNEGYGEPRASHPPRSLGHRVRYALLPGPGPDWRMNV